MDPKQLHILQHSLGLDQRGQGTSYRNHFVTGPGSTDHDDCTALVNAGLMTRRTGHPLAGGDDVFNVTASGRSAVAGHSPPLPKLTRAQQTYRDWLQCDIDVPFIEYAKWKSRVYAKRDNQ